MQRQEDEHSQAPPAPHVTSELSTSSSSSPQPLPRRPNPFSNLLTTARPVLKKQEKKRLFQTLPESLEHGKKKSPTERMRQVDALRLHVPTEAERAELNILSSTQRLNVHSLDGLLLLCGFRAGVRFHTHEIQTLRRTSRTLESQYAKINAVYEQLSSAPDLGLTFHAHVDTYLMQLKDLQVFMRVFEAQRTHESCRISESTETEESKQQLPEFLVILIQSHLCQGKNLVEGLTSLSAFATFLSQQVFHHVPLTEAERTSFGLLFQIVKLEGFESEKRLTQRQVARAFWTFFKTVRELRLVPHDPEGTFA